MNGIARVFFLPTIMRQPNVTFTQMDQHLYTCHYCGKKYVPKRRHKQKFCTASCRSKAWKHKNKQAPSEIKESKVQDEKEKKEGMSLAGIGNSATGILLFEMLKSFLTNEENKSASRGQAQEIIQLQTLQNLIQGSN